VDRIFWGAICPDRLHANAKSPPGRSRGG
jgi:hypothetical protein